MSETNTALCGIYFALLFLIIMFRHKKNLLKKTNKTIFDSYSVAILFNIAAYVSYTQKVGSGVQNWVLLG